MPTPKLRLARLTPEQEAMLPAIRDKWIAIGLSTERADRARANAAIRLAYRRAGLQEPSLTIWLDSPMAGAIGYAYLRALRTELTKRGLSSKAKGDSVWDSVGACVWASVRDSVWASVGASVRASVWDSVGASVRASIGASVEDSVYASVGASVRASVWDSVEDSVYASVGASVRASVGASVGASVRASVWDSVGASVGASVRASVWASVEDSVYASVGASVRASVWDSVSDSVYGQHDANWIGFLDTFTQYGLGDLTERADGLTALTESCGWYWPFRGVVILTERHSRLHRDASGRIHNAGGMAVQYPDGWGLYVWHGLRVAEAVILHPESITVQQIRDERNTELRRVLLERFGADRFVTESGAIPIHADECGSLYRVELPGDEPLVLVKLLNNTPEPSRDAGLIQAPDGSWRKQYWLRVPPDVETAREAVAWTFGQKANQYRPAVET